MSLVMANPHLPPLSVVSVSPGVWPTSLSTYSIRTVVVRSQVCVCVCLCAMFLTEQYMITIYLCCVGLKEAQWSPLADSERKDSLSINVEFVKFHLSRSRKLNFQQESDVTGKLSDQSRAVIRFSSE